MLRCYALLLLLLCLVCIGKPVAARVNPQKWGLTFTPQDSLAIDASAKPAIDSFVKLAPARQLRLQYNIQRPKPFNNAAPDFYLLCALCLMLGVVRYFEPRYFALLVGAYRNPGSGRQWHDMLRAAALPNLAMNAFFAIVTGAYIYYLSNVRTNPLLGVRAALVMPLMIAGMIVIYIGKYIIIRFSGWAFRVEDLADQYIFNVFLVNKIIGIVLLPFVVLIAFAGHQWVAPLGIVSGTIALAILSTRYLRSWPAFFAFFQGSKFHFFTYLCASEVLPMAVLVKWLLHLIR
jgi:hypothetical protein